MVELFHRLPANVSHFRSIMSHRYLLSASTRSIKSLISVRMPTTPQRSALARIRHYSSRRQSGNLAALTHIDETGRPAMVDVTAKRSSNRSATACGRIYVPRKALDLIIYEPDLVERTFSSAQVKARRKGDVLSVAQLAAIMGCKKTSELIPLCHPLSVSNIDVRLQPDADTMSILCTATVNCVGQTGVEMEALTAVSVGLLTVWDMLKAVAGQEMTIGDIKVIAKSGGKADYIRNASE